MRISAVLLVCFAVAVAVAGFALGFQLPGVEARVDPNTVTQSGPFADPGLRDLGSNHYEVYIVARAWAFDPSQITVPVGAEVTFYITSVDVQHGFKLRDTNVNLQIVPGHVSKLTTTFDRAGEYPFICTEFCGLGHSAMFGSLVVEEPAD
jgi:cytochrome c oxidase subunit 2